MQTAANPFKDEESTLPFVNSAFTRIPGLLIGLILLPTTLLAQPFVTNAVYGIYADVPDPVLISFAPDGSLYCGRDDSGSGGSATGAVKIHRVAPGGSPVSEFGDLPISDPDAVVVDVAGVVSGTPGSVIVGGIHTVANEGKLSKIAPDGTVTTLFGPSTAFENPSAFDFDQSGRLVFTELTDGSVQVTTGGPPTVLFALPAANRIVVDALNRIVVDTTSGNQLRLYSSSGALSNASFASVKGASPLARGPGGSWGTDIYAVGTNGALLRIDLDGNATAVGTGFGGITDFKFGPDGALYASEFTADRIYRFGPPTVPGGATTIYAKVTDPVRLSFAPDGSLFVGRDNIGSGGAANDAVRFHRVGSGGSPVEEYPATPISDADAVYYDGSGQFTGTAGAVLAGGVELAGNSGKLVKVLSNGTVVTVYGPTVGNFNPNLFVYDPVHGRLLFSDDAGGKVWVMTNTAPLALFNLANAFPLAVDSLGRILAAGNGPNINLYNATGAVLSNNFAVIQANSPIATGPGGFWGTGVYAVNDQGDLISIATDGNVTKVGSNFGKLTGFAFGPDGALYASQLENDLIWRVSPGPTAPKLSIAGAGPGQASISWTPDTPGFFLQENFGPSSFDWSNSPSGSNQPVVVPTTLPAKFYRLFKP